MDLVLGDPRLFAVVARPVEIPKATGSSLEVLTLADLRIQSGEVELSRQTEVDTGAPLVPLRVPLVDVADWIASTWTRLIYETAVPAPLARGHDRLGVSTLAARWAGIAAVDLTDDQQDALGDWAEHHALEFAATDYELPNVVLARVGECLEVSWSARTDPAPGLTCVFQFPTGACLLPVETFVESARSLLGWVRSRGADAPNDPRIVRIAEVLDQDVEQQGEQALNLWFPGWKKSLRPKVEGLESSAISGLGATGVPQTSTAAFLRSATGRLDLDDTRRILKTFQTVKPSSALENLEILAAGLDASVDPLQPWDSGCRLAQLVRRRLKDHLDLRADGPIEMEDLFARLGISVSRLTLGTREVEGVAMLERNGRVLAVLNESGRLARYPTGRRSTLAHELCHLLFDPRPAKVVGQVDLRVSPHDALEKRANAFAAEFLLPRAAVRAESRDNRLEIGTLRRIARRYGVGIDLARHQAQNQGLRILE